MCDDVWTLGRGRRPLRSWLPMTVAAHKLRDHFRPWLLLSLAILLTAAVLASRRPDKVAYPQFWAEDAMVFYADAELFGFHSLVRPYSGYLHTYQRLVALAGTHVPLLLLPAWYSAMAGVGTGLTIWAIWQSKVTARSSAAVLMGAAVLTAPFTGEIWYVLTNVQWVLALVLVLAAAAPTPVTARARVAWMTAVVLAGLTGPFALIFLPCALARCYVVPDRWSIKLLGAFLVCNAVALYTLAEHGRVAASDPVVSRALVLVERLHTRPGLAIGAVVGSIAFVFAAVKGLQRKDVSLAVMGAAGLAATTSVAFGTPLIVLGAIPWLGGRYVFIPWILACWTCILLIERGWRLAAVPLIGAGAIGCWYYSFPPLKHYDWRADAACLERRRQCDVTVNPEWFGGLPGRGTQPQAVAPRP